MDYFVEFMQAVGNTCPPIQQIHIYEINTLAHILNTYTHTQHIFPRAVLIIKTNNFEVNLERTALPVLYLESDSLRQHIRLAVFGFL